MRATVDVSETGKKKLLRGLKADAKNLPRFAAGVDFFAVGFLLILGKCPFAFETDGRYFPRIKSRKTIKAKNKGLQ